MECFQGTKIPYSHNPLPFIIPHNGGSDRKEVPGIWDALQLLVLYDFFLGFHSHVKFFGSGRRRRLSLQHQGQGLFFLERKGLISAFFLERGGGRYGICYAEEN